MEKNSERTDYAAYSDARRQQLEERGFPLWVFCHDPNSCEGAHEDLDGIAVPADHAFWRSFYPPLADVEDCSCYVVGARSDAGVERLGGDPAKPIPQWAIEAISRENSGDQRG